MYRNNPFGNPDGARADINEIETSFLFNDLVAPSTTVREDELLKKRFFVGAKGSGKTFYLRRVHSLLKGKNTGVYVADEIEMSLNCTENVVRFCSFFRRNIVCEKWEKLWICTIYTYLIMRYLFDDKVDEYCNEEYRIKLEGYFEQVGIPKEIRRPLGVYQIIQYYLMILDTAYKANSFLNAPFWFCIDIDIKDLVKYSPEIYILLDSVDEEYEHAPAFWLQCQKGLFYAGMHFLENRIYGEKLHIVTSMRTNVFASVIRSEHSGKYVRESHILYLNWNYNNICYFLEEKIANLSDCYFMKESIGDRKNDKNIYTWLGIKNIHNLTRKIDEDIKTYIIRHTRLTPRDIVIVCNHLAELKKTYINDTTLDIPEYIRHIVHEDAKLFGDELITVCTKQLNSAFMTSEIGRYNASDGFIANDIFRESSRRKIKSILQTIRSDRVTYDEICTLDKNADEEFGQRCYFSDILWQNVALGYYDEHSNKVIYFTRYLEVEPILPKNKKEYVFKTCLLDALDIMNVGKMPEL